LSKRKFDGPEVLVNNKKLLQKDQKNIMAIYKMCKDEHEGMEEAKDDMQELNIEY